MAAFIAQPRPTPYLVIDLDVVAQRYLDLTDALPGIGMHYAVKANSHPEILRLLVELGARFDVASPAEIAACLDAGARPDEMSFGNTIKRRVDVAAAHELGIRHFAVDCADEVDKVADAAPGSVVSCRILCSGEGAAWPLSRKFGCAPSEAIELLRRADAAGLGTGVGFHVGSQQYEPEAWAAALESASQIFDDLRAAGIEPVVVNLGGGFPGSYARPAPAIEEYGKAISRMVEDLGDRLPAEVIAEPGRHLVADAGAVQSEVLLVSTKEPGRRWVFLDVGVFTGLVETADEAIRYLIRTARDGGPTGPAVVAGPTCDSTDILYEHEPYPLPLDLAEGDLVQLLSAGAYTAACSSVGFNGFPPLVTHVLPRS